MCSICDAQESLAAAGVLVCGSCGSNLDQRCPEGHAFCACSEEMPGLYVGDPPTRCFRCATGI